MNNKKIIYILAGIVVLGGFLMWLGRAQALRYWPETSIECLPRGHEQLALHIHPHIAIIVDGEEEIIPLNIGITNQCMAEVHTHDTTGTIHVEATRRGKIFTLNDFFGVWGKTIERDGYDFLMTVNGEQSSESGALILGDKQEILLKYKK